MDPSAVAAFTAFCPAASSVFVPGRWDRHQRTQIAPIFWRFSKVESAIFRGLSA